MVPSREETRKLIAQINIDELNKVKAYLEEHPLAGIMQVCTATGVSPKQIHIYINHKLLKLRTDITPKDTK